LRHSLVALLAAVLLAGCATQSRVPLQADLLIQGGTIYPGGGEPFIGDIAVSGDKIVAVGKQLAPPAKRTIDARGLIVAPGFIDPHTHMEGWLTADDANRRLVEPFLMQGVTTAFVGNDGGGTIEVGDLLASARTKPVGINFATFTGFGTIRAKVIGAQRRAPTPVELAQEKGLVRKAMCEGALGLSTGLFYAPQSFSTTGEVVALAEVAGELGGVYDTHLRDEANYTVGLTAAVDEAIAIARDARIPVHISHIKALGADVQGMAPAIIARIDAARGAGLDVTAGQYPWEASGTSLVAALIPLWAQDGGRDAMLARFDDPALAARLKGEIGENMRRRGGAGSLLIVEGRWKGRRLDAVAEALGTDPASAAIATIREGDPATISFNMAESDIEAFMRQPWTMSDSDASTAHPRVYGSFARKYAVYVKERSVLSLREFIDRSSALTADWFGIEDRGRLRPGAFADVVVFDPARYASRATYEHPGLTAAGVRTVLVNGRLAVDDGKLTGDAAGRALPRTPPAGACQ
jgi:N-acyl-D-aspartate/D-glutamate deacylase